MSRLLCPECDGAGALLAEGPAVAGYNSAGAPFPEQREGRCDECGGTGRRRCAACGEEPAEALYFDEPTCRGCIREMEAVGV
jgi:hypothetical protein